MSWIEALERAKDPLHEVWERRQEAIADERQYPAQYTHDAVTMLLSPAQIDEIWGAEPEPQTAAAGRGQPGGPWQLRDVNGQWVNMELVERLLAGAVAHTGANLQALRNGFEQVTANLSERGLSAGDAAFPGEVRTFFDQGMMVTVAEVEAATMVAEALNNPQSGAFTVLTEGAPELPGVTDPASHAEALKQLAQDPGNAALREQLVTLDQAQAEALTAAQQEVYGPISGDALGEAGRAYASGSNGEINGYLRGHDVEASDDFALREWGERNGYGPEPSSHNRFYEPFQDYDWHADNLEGEDSPGLDYREIAQEQYEQAAMEVEEELDVVLQESDPYIPYDAVEAAVERAVGRAGNQIITGLGVEDGAFAVDVLRDSLMYDAIEARGYGVVVEDDSQWRGQMMDAYNREFQEHFFEIPQDVLVARTVDSRAIAALGEGAEGGDLVGDVFAHDAYVSTTLNNANPIDWHDGDNHLLVIEVPEGTEAFYMPGAFPDLSFNGRENELVLPPGTEIEITDFMSSGEVVEPLSARRRFSEITNAMEPDFLGEGVWQREVTDVDRAAVRELLTQMDLTPDPEAKPGEAMSSLVRVAIDTEGYDELTPNQRALLYSGFERVKNLETQRTGLNGPWKDMNGVYFAKVVPRHTEVSRDIADTIRAQGGFTYDPVGETFVDSGYQVAIPGNETRIDTAEFEERGWEIVDKLFEASAGKQIGGWEYEGQYVFDVSENHRSIETAGAAMIDRGEQALYDFAGQRSVYNPRRWEELEPGVYSVWEPETLSIVDRDRSAGTYVETADGLWVWRPNNE